MKYFRGRYIIKFMYRIVENFKQCDIEEKSVSWIQRSVAVSAYMSTV